MRGFFGFTLEGSVNRHHRGKEMQQAWQLEQQALLLNHEQQIVKENSE